jgi:hypothetical protein
VKNNGVAYTVPSLVVVVLEWELNYGLIVERNLEEASTTTEIEYRGARAT